jgi:hypothetical protein
MKIQLLLGTSLTAWLVALSPVPNLAKAVSYSVAIVSSIRSVEVSRQLIDSEKLKNAIALMDEELRTTEVALHTYYQEQQLETAYASTYAPVVREEINQSLEHLLDEDSAQHPLETSASTSDLKSAITALLAAGKSQTFIIEDVLGCKGRRFEEGKRRLQQILGVENE